MAIRVMAATEAPDRFYKSGIVSGKADYTDIINALKAQGNAGKAIVCDMDPKAWEGVEKPETKLGYALRRYLETKNPDITAYQSAKMQITVRKMTAAEKAQHESDKRNGNRGGRKTK